jgi:hypothetical protein
VRLYRAIGRPDRIFSDNVPRRFGNEMRQFDPTLDILSARLLLDANGEWPNFHDSVVHSLKLWNSSARPENGSTIDVAIELAALKDPFVAVLRFHECSDINLGKFDTANDVFDLSFALRERGYYLDGITPLPPHIHVEFVPAQFGFSLRLDCFSVEVLEKRAADEER